LKRRSFNQQTQSLNRRTFLLTSWLITTTMTLSMAEEKTMEMEGQTKEMVITQQGEHGHLL